MEYKNIIFDVDGTLLDSYTPYMNALEKAVYKFTGNILDDKTKDKLFHMTNDEIMKYVGVNPNEYEDFIKYNDSYLNVNEVSLYEGIEELIIYLHNRGYFLGINTSRNIDEVYEVPCLVKILKYFDCIMTCDKVKNPKPDKESLIKIINDNKLDIGKTIMIGDSINDSNCAVNSLCKFGLASWGARDKSIYCDYYLNDVKDIYKIIKKEEEN